jgi:hypothetical protein
MMMTRRKLYVTLRTAALAAMALCAAIIAGCNDQLLPPEQPAQMSFQGRIFYSAPMPSLEDVILSISATDTVPDTIAMGRLTSAPQKGNIAYYRADGPSGVGSVYIKEQGKNEQWIYSGTIEPASITLAPDGLTVGFLAYSSPLDYDLHVISPASGLDRTVPLYGMDVVTSPDEQSIWLTPGGDTAFIGSLGKGQLGYMVYAVDLLGGGMITPQYYGMGFMTGLAFSSDFQPALTVTGGDMNGSGVITITTVNNYQRENLVVEGSDYYHSPAWSPDGGNIAFTVNGSMGDMDLYTISSRGSTSNGAPLRRITYTPDMNEFYTNWSPDGSRILFTEMPAYTMTPDSWQSGRLMIVDPQSKQTRVIADNAYKGFWGGS